MSRPTSLLKDATLYWVIRLYNSSGVLVDADSTPTVAVRKNGSSVGDSVTVTKRSATTGIYDCSYNPASEVEGDQFTIEETSVISSTTYTNSWEFRITAAERGTDSAYTGTPPTAAAIASQTRTELATELARIDVATSSRLASASYSAPPSVGDIQSGLATTVGMTAAFTEIKGAGWSSSTDTLEKIRDASGGSNIVVTPIQGTTPSRNRSTTIEVFYKTTNSYGPIAVVDSTSTAVDLSGMNLELIVEDKRGTNLSTITDFTISGDDNNQFTFDIPSATTDEVGSDFNWALRNVDDGRRVILEGRWIVSKAAN